MKILFMGSPDFAVVSLEALIKNGHDIVGVVSVPDKPKGRGNKLTPTAVKVAAQEKGICVFTPATLKDNAFLETLKMLNPEAIVVVAYGKILPKYILDYSKYGCFNVHGSLLPEYRGAAPMQRAIIDGKEKTGVTVQLMAEGIDTGDMLLKKEYIIKENDNFEDVHDALAVLGSEAICEVLELAKKDSLKREVQNERESSYAEKITKEECRLDFTLSALSLHNKIRGMSPFPLAFTHTPDGKVLKIVKAMPSDKKKEKSECGTVISTADGKITVSCGEGSLDILCVLPEGKGRMSAADFIRGRKINEGELLN